jgi:hypothetical protein
MRVIRFPLYASLLGSIMWGCQDGQNPVTPEHPVVGTSDFLPGSGIPANYVTTPAGLYHRSCVHEIPNGARVDRNVVTLLTGVTYQIPDCLYPSLSNFRAANSSPTAAGPTGWKEWTSAVQFGNTFKRISANWAVPAAPSGFYATGLQKTYFTFPGLEGSVSNTPAQRDFYILQPVLQYGSTGEYGGAYWTITSWRCNDNTNCIHSAPITVSPGDSINGSVFAYNCSAGSCRWHIQAYDYTTVQATVLDVGDTENYYFATGGAVETFGMTGCNDYPSHGVFYSSVAVTDVNDNPEIPSWSRTILSPPADGTPACNFNVTFTNTTTNLFHGSQSDPPPPPPPCEPTPPQLVCDPNG